MKHRVRVFPFYALFIGWMSYYLCQRTLPSAMAWMISSSEKVPVLLDDEAMAKATSSIKTEFSKAYVGQLQSLFAVAYAISSLVTGILSDVINVKILFSVGLGVSGALLALFPYTEGNHLLGSILYFILGLFQGMGWPSTAKILRQTFPPSELGLPWGLMATGCSIASTLSPFLVSFIIGASSWQYSFYTFGILALSLTLPVMALTSFFPNRPTGKFVELPSTEKRTMDGSLPESKLRWFHIFMFGNIWCVMAIHSTLWLVKTCVQDWGQLYLIQKRGLAEASAGYAIGLMQFGGVLGKMTMGYVSTLAMKSQGIGPLKTTGRICRTYVLIIDLLLLCGMVLLFATLEPSLGNVSYLLLSVIFCIGLFAEGSVIIASLSSMDLVPKTLSGTGQAASAASSHIIGRFLAGWPFSSLVEKVGWNSGFMVLSGMCLVAVAVGTFLVVHLMQAWQQTLNQTQDAKTTGNKHSI